MVVVDASVWVSCFFAADQFHDLSRSWVAAAGLQGETLASPAVLLPEVSGALARRTGKSELARRVVQALLQFAVLRLVSMQAAVLERATAVAADLRMCGTDALYVAVAWQLRVPLVTWDAEQEERARSLITVWTPREALAHLLHPPET